MNELFLKALSEYYNNDQLSPGIVSSFVSERQVFYASVNRYQFNGRKEVVVKVESKESMAVALDALADAWKEKVAPRKTNLAAFMESGPTIHVLKTPTSDSNCDGV